MAFGAGDFKTLFKFDIVQIGYDDILDVVLLFHSLNFSIYNLNSSRIFCPMFNTCDASVARMPARRDSGVEVVMCRSSLVGLAHTHYSGPFCIINKPGNDICCGRN